MIKLTVFTTGFAFAFAVALIIALVFITIMRIQLGWQWDMWLNHERGRSLKNTLFVILAVPWAIAWQWFYLHHIEWLIDEGQSGLAILRGAGLFLGALAFGELWGWYLRNKNRALKRVPH